MSKSLPAPVEMTNVVGYFNPNTWRIQLAISELNYVVPLAPMDYVLDRTTGRKINDPLLERFVGPKMLERELSADKQVPVVRIPPAPVQRADPHAHPVRQGHKDAKGKWHPPTAAAVPAPNTAVATVTAPSASKSSVMGMSIEEAKKRGFIGKQRLVPEDYGAEENTGAPTRGDVIPRIKHSFEAPAPMAMPGALPKELVDDAKASPNAALVQNLEKVAGTDPDAAPKLTRKETIAAVREQQGEAGVQKLKQALVAKAPAPAVPVPAAVPAPASAPIAAPVPAPARKVRVAAPIVEEQPAESPLVGGRPEGLPEPQLDEQPAAAPTSAAGSASKSKTTLCPECGHQAQYPSHLKRHIQRTHKDKEAQILARL